MRRSETGFTLLEVLVAFVIAALALGVLYRGAIGGIGSARVATQYESAVSRARSRLATIGHGSEIVAGEQSGDDGGGFAWRTRITAAQVAGKPVTPDAKIATLYTVSVAISWGAGAAARQVELDTKRVGFIAPPRP